MASGRINCAFAYIVKSTLSYSDFVSWSNSIIDGSVDGDVIIEVVYDMPCILLLTSWIVLL